MKHPFTALMLAVTLATTYGADADEYWLITEDYRKQFIGNFTKAEVDSLRTQISKISLPYEFGSKGSFFPPTTMRAKVLIAWDANAVDARGRMGGLIEDYWLNSQSVLRVVQVYYKQGDRRISRVEKLAIVSAVEAYVPLPKNPFP
ncbi:MAG: hypothetical protein JNL39_11715 [Opitutaceae bacterium]|nr:hypothetical protein [Opitutaceae bacterium]